MRTFNEYITEKESGEKTRWITIDGKHVLINKETGEIESGLGGKFNGKSVDDLKEPERKPFSATDAVTGKSAHNDAQPTKKLTDKQVSAIMSYSGSMYSQINLQLRGLGSKNSYASDLVKRLDSVMKSAKTTKDMIVYRGITSSLFSKLEVGAVLKDAGFGSTTTKQSVAKGFADSSTYTSNKKGENANPVIMKVQVPKGSRALSMMKYSQYKDEEEILIDRNSRYKVISISGSDRKTVTVELEQD